jgi:hypothetical protein
MKEGNKVSGGKRGLYTNKKDFLNLKGAVQAKRI